MLPATLRSPLLVSMYGQVLETFPFATAKMTQGAINTLLIKLAPLVLMRGMALIEANTVSSSLYVLQRGCLRVALPMKKSEPKANRMRSARVSTSPLRGVKGGGLGLKSTKEFTRFRVLERPGATVGVADIDRAQVKYPFHVDCTRTTQLFGLGLKDLRGAIEAMATDDADKCKTVLQKEHKVQVDGLKYDGANEAALPPKASVAKAACQDVVALQTRLEGVHAVLSATRETTTAIPALVKQLGGTYMPHLSPRHQQQVRDALHAEQAQQRVRCHCHVACRGAAAAPAGPARSGLAAPLYHTISLLISAPLGLPVRRGAAEVSCDLTNVTLPASLSTSLVCGPQATRAAARTSVVGSGAPSGSSQGKDKHKDSTSLEQDELEERTHYAALSNFNVAAMARVVS